MSDRDKLWEGSMALLLAYVTAVKALVFDPSTGDLHSRPRKPPRFEELPCPIHECIELGVFWDRELSDDEMRQVEEQLMQEHPDLSRLPDGYELLKGSLNATNSKETSE